MSNTGSKKGERCSGGAVKKLFSAIDETTENKEFLNIEKDEVDCGSLFNNHCNTEKRILKRRSKQYMRDINLNIPFISVRRSNYKDLKFTKLNH